MLKRPSSRRGGESTNPVDAQRIDNNKDAARVAGRLVTLPALAPPAGITSLAPRLYRDR